ncbi:hypothetical protein Ancab_031259 [Ancistrocladus abbreviatus]
MLVFAMVMIPRCSPFATWLAWKSFNLLQEFSSEVCMLSRDNDELAELCFPSSEPFKKLLCTIPDRWTSMMTNFLLEVLDLFEMLPLQTGTVYMEKERYVFGCISVTPRMV